MVFKPLRKQWLFHFWNQSVIIASLMSRLNSVINCFTLPLLAALKRACFAPFSLASTLSRVVFCCVIDRPIKRSKMSAIIQSICSSCYGGCGLEGAFFAFWVTFLGCFFLVNEKEKPVIVRPALCCL